jgi:hypothetical protein
MYRGLYNGKYFPDHPEKYVGDPAKIIYRSSWERRMMQWMDRSPNVVKWASEEVVVPYVSPVDGEIHRYFVDFAFTTSLNKKFLVEVKPSQFCVLPKKRNSKQYLKEVEMYAVNQAKWKSARQFAKKHGMEFVVITEKELGM